MTCPPSLLGVVAALAGLACSSGAPAVTPPFTPAPASAVADVPPDARVADDLPPPDAAQPMPVTLDWPTLRRESDQLRATPLGTYPCDWRKPSRQVECDPPGPPRPRRVAGRIVRGRPDGSGAVIEIDRGTDDGVEREWAGVVVDRDGRIVTRNLKVLGVANSGTRAGVDLPLDQALSHARVVLMPSQEAAALP
jgi:hypothetical protein